MGKGGGGGKGIYFSHHGLNKRRPITEHRDLIDQSGQ